MRTNMTPSRRIDPGAASVLQAFPCTVLPEQAIGCASQHLHAQPRPSSPRAGALRRCGLPASGAHFALRSGVVAGSAKQATILPSALAPCAAVNTRLPGPAGGPQALISRCAAVG